MGLLLRPDAFHAADSAGMYLLTYRGSSHVKGRSVGPLLDLLKPYLDGRHTLAELTEELPPERRAAVESLLAALLERDVVRDVGTADPDAVLEYPGYRHEVAFIGHFRDSPISIFRAYRDKVVLVLGSGDMVPWVARAAVLTGSRLVRWRAWSTWASNGSSAGGVPLTRRSSGTSSPTSARRGCCPCSTARTSFCTSPVARSMNRCSTGSARSGDPPGAGGRAGR